MRGSPLKMMMIIVYTVGPKIWPAPGQMYNNKTLPHQQFFVDSFYNGMRWQTTSSATLTAPRRFQRGTSLISSIVKTNHHPFSRASLIKLNPIAPHHSVGKSKQNAICGRRMWIASKAEIKIGRKKLLLLVLYWIA